MISGVNNFASAPQFQGKTQAFKDVAIDPLRTIILKEIKNGNEDVTKAVIEAYKKALDNMTPEELQKHAKDLEEVSKKLDITV